MTTEEREKTILRAVRAAPFGTCFNWEDIVDLAAFGYVEAYEMPHGQMWCKLKPAGREKLERLEREAECQK